MKILVLASGGLDSTVLLYRAVKEVDASNVFALNMYYGQKHHKEMECFQWQVEHLGIENYKVLDLSFIFKDYRDCTLLKGGGDIPHKSYAEQLAENPGTVSTYVPFRNGLFLSVAASIALQESCGTIWYGAHADDAAGRAYPDCTPEFIEAQNKAIEEGTAGQVHMHAPLWNKNKASVVGLGLELGMSHEEFEHTWSCYEGKEEPCKTCGTCRDRKEAFVANGINDID